MMQDSITEHVSLLGEVALGTVIILLTIIVAAFSAWFMEWLFARSQRWLLREPHRPKLMLVVLVASVWVLAMVTVDVWIWALTLRTLELFPTLEAAVYFSLVSFTTLGFGDVLLHTGWRVMGAMIAANGFLMFGLLTAFLVEALRHLRLSQAGSRRKVD